MVAYAVEALEEVTLDIAGSDGRLAGYDLMSPFVWTEGARYRLLVRVLPRPLGIGDPTGVIWCGDSSDGLSFVMRTEPSITPGPDPVDLGGCEDPTVVRGAKGAYLVFYTGVDMKRQQGALLVAEGPDLTNLRKQRVMLKAPEGEGNIKEATLAKGAGGQYHLFYEYARGNASRIGMAVGPNLEGPWTTMEDPFTVREDRWDNWHLSTGPIVQRDGEDPVMFYNGATADARWRIGWISFSPDFACITGRGLEPLLIPPPPQDRTATDIAFAASCLVQQDDIWLYFSLEDRILRRALVRGYGRADLGRSLELPLHPRLRTERQHGTKDAIGEERQQGGRRTASHVTSKADIACRPVEQHDWSMNEPRCARRRSHSAEVQG